MDKAKKKSPWGMSYKKLAAIAKYYDGLKGVEIPVEFEKGVSILAEKQRQPPRHRERRGRMRKAK